MKPKKSKVSEKIELILFDILYLVMNCDFEVSEEEEDFFEDAMKPKCRCVLFFQRIPKGR